MQRHAMSKHRNAGLTPFQTVLMSSQKCQRFRFKHHLPPWLLEWPSPEKRPAFYFYYVKLQRQFTFPQRGSIGVIHNGSLRIQKCWSPCHTLNSSSERVQKRALSIIAPDKSYKHCVVSFGLSTLYDRRNDNSISSDQHKFACLLSPNLQGYYNTRQERVYDLPHFRANRCKNSFKPAMCSRPNMLL